MPIKVSDFDFGPERLIVRFDTDGPIDLEELAKSFASLEHLYQKQQTVDRAMAPPTPARLFVSKIETGSIILQIAPLMMLLNEPLQFMAATNTITTFAQNVILLLRTFAGDAEGAKVAADRETVRALQTFIKPLTGRKAAELGITHARFEKRDKKGGHVLAEYRMRAPEINIANSNLVHLVETEDRLLAAARHEMKREVLMRLFQALVIEGKERGRTGDRVIIAAVTDRDLPLYFPKQTNDYKRIITEGTEFPFSKGYIVDVDVAYDGDVPKVYHLLHLHKVVDMDG